MSESKIEELIERFCTATCAFAENDEQTEEALALAAAARSELSALREELHRHHNLCAPLIEQARARAEQAEADCHALITRVERAEDFRALLDGLEPPELKRLLAMAGDDDEFARPFLAKLDAERARADAAEAEVKLWSDTYSAIDPRKLAATVERAERAETRCRELEQAVSDYTTGRYVVGVDFADGATQPTCVLSLARQDGAVVVLSDRVQIVADRFDFWNAVTAAASLRARVAELEERAVGSRQQIGLANGAVLKLKARISDLEAALREALSKSLAANVRINDGTTKAILRAVIDGCNRALTDAALRPIGEGAREEQS